MKGAHLVSGGLRIRTICLAPHEVPALKWELVEVPGGCAAGVMARPSEGGRGRTSNWVEACALLFIYKIMWLNTSGY